MHTLQRFLITSLVLATGAPSLGFSVQDAREGRTATAEAVKQAVPPGALPPESLHEMILAADRGDSLDSAKILTALLDAYGTTDASVIAARGLGMSIRHPAVLGLVGRLTPSDANRLSAHAADQVDLSRGAVTTLAVLVCEAEARGMGFREPKEQLLAQLYQRESARKMLAPTFARELRWRRSEDGNATHAIEVDGSEFVKSYCSAAGSPLRVGGLEGMLVPKSGGAPMRIEFAPPVSRLDPAPRSTEAWIANADIPAGSYELRLNGWYKPTPMLRMPGVAEPRLLQGLQGAIDATIAVVVESAESQIPAAHADDALAAAVGKVLETVRLSKDPDFGVELSAPRALASLVRDDASLLGYVIEWRQDGRRAAAGTLVVTRGGFRMGGGPAPSWLDAEKPFTVGLIASGRAGFAHGEVRKDARLLGCSFELSFDSAEAEPKVAQDCSSGAVATLTRLDRDAARHAIAELVGSLEGKVVRTGNGFTLQLRRKTDDAASKSTGIELSGTLSVLGDRTPVYGATPVAGRELGALYDSGLVELDFERPRELNGARRDDAIVVRYTPDASIAALRMPMQRTYIAEQFVFEVNPQTGRVTLREALRAAPEHE